MKKLIFHILNVIFICLYVYPGSIFGFLFYGNFNKQPQITSDFIVSSNHVYAFLILSFVGFFTYKKIEQLKFLSIYLIFLSITLEILHHFIPERSFQFTDLFGNLVGVIIVIIIFYFFKKNENFKN